MNYNSTVVQYCTVQYRRCASCEGLLRLIIQWQLQNAYGGYADVCVLIYCVLQSIYSINVCGYDNFRMTKVNRNNALKTFFFFFDVELKPPEL